MFLLKLAWTQIYLGSLLEHIELLYNQNSWGECTLHCYDFIGCLEIANGQMNWLWTGWNLTVTLYTPWFSNCLLFHEFESWEVTVFDIMRLPHPTGAILFLEQQGRVLYCTSWEHRPIRHKELYETYGRYGVTNYDIVINPEFNIDWWECTRGPLSLSLARFHVCLHNSITV